MIHRDITPKNILIDAHHHLLLGDFGLSRIMFKRKWTCASKEQPPSSPDLSYTGPAWVVVDIHSPYYAV